jgi:tRNA 2-thiouridine synthesizing protein B
MILHTFNKPPQAAQLALLTVGDSVLLLEDAVYAALPLPAGLVLPKGLHCHVLREDLVLRGISARIRPGFAAVDYSGFVALCLSHRQVLNWN